MQKQIDIDFQTEEFIEKVSQVLRPVVKFLIGVFEMISKTYGNDPVLVKRLFITIEINEKSQKRLYFRKKRSQAKRKKWRK